jgi:hypothetical protein
VLTLKRLELPLKPLLVEVAHAASTLGRLGRTHGFASPGKYPAASLITAGTKIDAGIRAATNPNAH